MVPTELERAHRVRRVLREGGQKMMAAGVEPVDVAFGAFCASLDLAEQTVGEGQAAIEWVRTACDVMESALLNGAPRVPE